MPWAKNEPVPLPEKIELLRRFRGNFDLGEDFVYGLFSDDESTVVGGSGLHRRVGQDAFEIGYWIRSSEAGHGLATEATAALTRVGLELCGADRIEIRVEPENHASLAIPRKLGFTEEGTLRRRLDSGDPGGARRDAVVFSMFRDDLPGTPVSTASFEAFDAIGARLG
jgi:RimJ/RimL family protein N-acetyltransferase